MNKLDTSTAEVLLYGYIDPYDVSAGDFVKELRSLEKEYSKINVRINSAGGSVFEGFAIYNAIKQSKATINTFIDGLAASMASIIALAGNKVHMSRQARLMTHQPSSGSYGNSDELRKNADLLDGLEKTMCAIYAAKTGKSMDDCKTAFLNGKDNWFDAEAALENKLVDEVYDATGIEVPSETANIKTVWNEYHHQFAAKFQQNQIENMELKLSAASLAALDITAAVTDATAIDNAIGRLKAKADQADAFKAAAEKAENDLNDLRAQNIEKDVAAQLEKAIDEKRITAEQKNVFAKQYAQNPDELKELLDTMKPFESKIVTGAPEAGEAARAELAALMAKTGKQLWLDGKLGRLKELNKEAWKAKYKEAFDADPEEE